MISFYDTQTSLDTSNQSYDGFIQGVVDPRVTEASIFGVSFVCIPALGPVQPVHFVILDTPVA